MKKVLMLATAAFLFTGVSFAQEKTEKKCAKGKECCKKEGGKESCTKDAAKAKAAKTAAIAKPAAAKAKKA
jgi:hypothetical protein